MFDATDRLDRYNPDALAQARANRTALAVAKEAARLMDATIQATAATPGVHRCIDCGQPTTGTHYLCNSCFVAVKL